MIESKYQRNPNLTEDEQRFWDAINLPPNTTRVTTRYGEMLMEKIEIVPRVRPVRFKE